MTGPAQSPQPARASISSARLPVTSSPNGFGSPQTPPGLPGVILARVECDYKRPSRYGDTLEIRMRVAEVGRTSFRYEYEIVDAEGRTVLTARTVQVMYDYDTDKPVPIPDRIRTLLEQ